ncbi:unnamed protein product [Adineta steineri]|uniref:3-hydroxyisobutyryl-CoA hydrolase, mitochondrial n=1 Tax=Adineta steineri TaxID=433720 RepID=A0A818WXS2_9BILA|nr:unnamed protein product [Adineta steineri]CAF3731403.1 unnamed protein product [Adineta steineri]
MFRALTHSCLHQSHRTLVCNLTTSTSPVSDKKAATESNATDDDVKFFHVNRTGIIQLNRPKQLNCMTITMGRLMSSKLQEWNSDGYTQLIIIKGAGSKAFSAGGDMKGLLAKTIDGERLRRDFFYDGYQTYYLTSVCKVPYVALINGITMGGGCGMSLHGSFQVATEMTTLAMPETSIGFFPDAGGSHFLPRLSNNVGVFLALTGHRLRGLDVVHVGLATHFVQSSRLAHVEQKLSTISNADHESVERVLDENNEAAQLHTPFTLEPHLSLINRIFSLDAKNVESIMQELKSNGSEFALKQHAILQTKSPTSLKLTFEQLKRGKHLDLKDCLKMEYNIAQHLMKRNDFFEGSRAVLVDKDNKPRWQPTALSDISDDDIARFFEKLPADEELKLP